MSGLLSDEQLAMVLSRADAVRDAIEILSAALVAVGIDPLPCTSALRFPEAFLAQARELLAGTRPSGNGSLPSPGLVRDAIGTLREFAVETDQMRELIRIAVEAEGEDSDDAG